MNDLSISELDELRAAMMRALLDPEGRYAIWSFTVMGARRALINALSLADMESIQLWRPDRRYAFVGPSVHHVYFNSVGDLGGIVLWMCNDPAGTFSAHAARSLRDPTRRMNAQEADAMTRFVMASFGVAVDELD